MIVGSNVLLWPGLRHRTISASPQTADDLLQRASRQPWVEGDRRLFNQYGVMLVNPAKHPNVKVSDGQAFVDWLVSREGQSTIALYKIGGQQLFFPDAEASK
jgi:ABC-type tungstate transport system permease subunit